MGYSFTPPDFYGDIIKQKMHGSDLDKVKSIGGTLQVECEADEDWVCFRLKDHPTMGDVEIIRIRRDMFTGRGDPIADKFGVLATEALVTALGRRLEEMTGNKTEVSVRRTHKSAFGELTNKIGPFQKIINAFKGGA